MKSRRLALVTTTSSANGPLGTARLPLAFPRGAAQVAIRSDCVSDFFDMRVGGPKGAPALHLRSAVALGSFLLSSILN